MQIFEINVTNGMNKTDPTSQKRKATALYKPENVIYFLCYEAYYITLYKLFKKAKQISILLFKSILYVYRM